MYYIQRHRRWLFSFLYILLVTAGQSLVVATGMEEKQAIQPSEESIQLPSNHASTVSSLAPGGSTTESEVSQTSEHSTTLESSELPAQTERPSTSTVLETINPSHTSHISIPTSVPELGSSAKATEIKPPSDTDQHIGELEPEPVEEVEGLQTEDQSVLDSSQASPGEVPVEVPVVDDDKPAPREAQEGETISALPEQPDGQHETASQAQFKTVTNLAGHGGMAVDVDSVGNKEEKQEEEGLTFNEWTQKVLAEAEKDKKDVDIEGSQKPVGTKKQRKNKNYALLECGAKILAHNPEAEDTRSVLNFNKDEYMINPCKAKKWFVIELCEPMQAHSVEIASLELFSSPPKYFKVYLSDRYPTKDWRLAGEFNTTEERVVQSFLITQLQGYFAKYVRVELLDHYGDEHFCPVTLFRVHGKGVEEDDDIPNVGQDVDDDDDDDDEEDVEKEDDSKTDTKTLFSSAKNIVLNVVKQVLNVEELEGNNNGTDMDAAAPDADGQLNGTAERVAHEDQMPCPPSASVAYTGNDDVSKETVSGTKPVTPTPGPSDATPAIVTKLDDDEQEETTVHIGAHLPDGSIPRTSESPLESCLHGPLLDLPAQSWFPSNLCRFILLVLSKCSMYREAERDEHKPVFVELRQERDEEASTVITVVPTSQMHTIETAASKSTSADGADTTERTSSVPKSESGQSSTNQRGPSAVTASGQVTSGQVTSSVSSLGSPRSAGSKIGTLSSVKDSASLSGLETSIEPTATQTAFVQTSTCIETSDSTPSTLEQTGPSSSTPDIVIHSSQSTTVDGEKVSGEHSTTPTLPTSWKPNTDDLQDTAAITTHPSSLNGQAVSQTTFVRESGQVPTKTVSDQVILSSVDASTISVSSTGDKQKPTDDTLSQQQQQNQQQQEQEGTTDNKQEATVEKSAVEEKPADTDKGVPEKQTPGKVNLDLVHVPVIPTKRESAIMRLSNRMKVIEQNVSLSSRFLEELSRRYKKQSEDMMNLLNKTMARLNNMTVESQVSNKLHQDEMGEMERRMENLTAIVTRLTTSLEQLNKQVTDRQMIWTSIEIIVIVIVLLVTRRRRAESTDIPTEIRELLESMPSKPATITIPRRNSISGPATPSKTKDMMLGGMQKFSSEISLALPANTKHGTTEASIKQKKKKKKQRQLDLKCSATTDGLPHKKKPPDMLPWKPEDAQSTSGLPKTSSSESVTSGASDSRGVISRKSTQHSGQRPVTKTRSGSLTDAGTLVTGAMQSAAGPPVGTGMKLKNHRRNKSLPKVTEQKDANKMSAMVTDQQVHASVTHGTGLPVGAEFKVKGHRRNKSLPKVTDQKGFNERVGSANKQMTTTCTGEVDHDCKKTLHNVVDTSSVVPLESYKAERESGRGRGKESELAFGFEEVGSKVKKIPQVNGSQHKVNYPKGSVLNYKGCSPMDQASSPGLLYCTSSLNDSLEYDYGTKQANVTNGFGVDHDHYSACSGTDAMSEASKPHTVSSCGTLSSPDLSHISQGSLGLSGGHVITDTRDEYIDFHSTKTQDNYGSSEGRRRFWFFNR